MTDQLDRIQQDFENVRFASSTVYREWLPHAVADIPHLLAIGLVARSYIPPDDWPMLMNNARLLERLIRRGITSPHSHMGAVDA